MNPSFVNSTKLIADDSDMSFKERCSEFALSTTSHGLNRIATSESWSGKILWTFLFLLLTIVFLYQSILLIVDYFQYPIVTKIKVINQQNQMFPAITVCNQNRIMKSLLPGTRFESLPAIDKNFCACRFVGGLNGDQLGAEKRKRRNVEDSEFGYENRMGFDDLQSCSERKVDFQDVDEFVKARYRKRFRRDIQDLEKEISDYDLHDSFGHEDDLLNEVHKRITAPGRRMKRSGESGHLANMENVEGGIDYRRLDKFKR